MASPGTHVPIDCPDRVDIPVQEVTDDLIVTIEADLGTWREHIAAHTRRQAA